MDQWKYELASAVLEWKIYALQQTQVGEKSYPSQPERDVPQLSARSLGWEKAIEIVAWHFTKMAGEQLFGSKYGHGLVLYGLAYNDDKKQEEHDVKEAAGKILNMILTALKTAYNELPDEKSHANFHASRGAMQCAIDKIKSLIKEYGCNHEPGEVKLTAWEDGPPEPYCTCLKCRADLFICPECDTLEYECKCKQTECENES